MTTQSGAGDNPEAQRLADEIKGELLDHVVMAELQAAGDETDAREAFESAIDRLASLAQRNEQRAGWQPIETAPTNGFRLLMVTDKGVITIRKRNKHLHIWVDDEGRETMRGFVGWMPLPAAPTQTGEPTP